jgi:SAM-dependent methyltransferase
VPGPAPEPGSGLIDVQQLIRTLSDEDLLAAADAYFAGLTPDSEQCRKPFSNPADAVHIHRNLGLLLQAADLFRGADVLDFGCATGWLTMSLASLGCRAVGVDISPQAIALAETLLAKRSTPAAGSATFRAYGGAHLPLEDASMDRVLCFDAFHHVRDQRATLRELARVLRPGGRIAMLEPGPHHSRTPQSQAEMALYKVIENDVDIAQVAAAAAAAGLDMPQVLVQLPEPLVLPFEKYLGWSVVQAVPAADGQDLLHRLAQDLTNTQCFFLAKPGAAVVDSRQAAALAAELRLLSTEPVAGSQGVIEFRIAIRNTGEAEWLVQPGAAGQVRLGVELLAADGSLRSRDFVRVPLAAAGAQPGGEQVVALRLDPSAAGGGRFRFDLVAEHVIWFSQNGRTSPLDWPRNPSP